MESEEVENTYQYPRAYEVTSETKERAMIIYQSTKGKKLSELVQEQRDVVKWNDKGRPTVVVQTTNHEFVQIIYNA